MKFKILCAANDVGGGNLISTIAPLLLSNLDYEIFFVAAGETLIKWRNEYFTKEIFDSPYDVIKNNQPDLIITGASLSSDFERKIWSIANNLNIPTFAMIDGWLKIVDRLKNNCGRQILPDIIGVSDYKVAEELTQTLNILKGKIYVIGHPHLQSSVTEIKSLRKYKNVNASESVLFLSSPIYGNEADYGIITLKEIVPYLEKYFPDYKIIIRPHSCENKISWINFCAGFNNTSSLRVIIDHKTPINIQLSSTKLLLGLPTITMLQGAFSDIPSLVFKFALSDDYHNPATDYYLSNHTVNYVDEIESAFQLITYKPSLPQIIYDELINYSISNSMEAISSIINLITLNCF